jgi:outer membrane protein assembly factor BamB
MNDDQMRRVRIAFACATLGALTACGGDGGSSPPPPPPPPPPPAPAPAMASSFTPARATAQAVEGGTGQFSFTIQVTNPDAGPLVPVVVTDSADIVQVGAVDTSVPNRYVVSLATAPGIVAGNHRGSISFKLCSDSSCATAHAGGTQSLPYAVDIDLKDGWGNFQRDAAHTGFADIQLDPADFAPAWTWQRPAGDGEPIGGINAVATGDGKVYVTKDVYFGQAAVYALDEATGTQAWTYAIGPMHSEGPAAFANGTVYVPSQDQGEQGKMWAIDSTTGAYKFMMPTGGQWSNYFAPTVLGDAIGQVTYDGGIYEFSTLDGSQKWTGGSNVSDQSTPALDATRFYAYGATYGNPALHVFDRATGATVATIGDPFSSGNTGYDMFSATMLGATNDAIAFSGSGFSGRAASSSEQYEQRILVSYDLVHSSVGWRSANAYLTHPALAKGVVYAARNAPASLDALSEADGHLLWSWTPPAGDTSFHRNILVTHNLVFVSTDQNVYAIDLATHEAVWHVAKSGMLALSSSGLLLITTGATLSDGNLVAIKLK